MGKFFLREQKAKQRKRPNYRATILKDIFVFLKEKHRQKIRKIIKTIRQEGGTAEKELIRLKTINKAELRKAAQAVMQKTLQLTNKTKKISGQITGETQSFVDQVLVMKDFVELIEKQADLKDQVSHKKLKRVAKRKESKIKKKKNQLHNYDNQSQGDGVEDGVGDGVGDGVTNGITNGITNEFAKRVTSGVSNKVFQSRPNDTGMTKAVPKYAFENIESSQKIPRTEFVKTGRNKFKQDKLNAKFVHVQPQPRHDPHIREQPSVLHPSWGAKRELKEKMFLRPFEGKRTLL